MRQGNRHAAGVHNDNELSVAQLKELVTEFKGAVKKQTGKDFPTDPMEQVWGAVGAVFSSWMNARAIKYRELNGIPESWGTAVNVQAMVFGQTVGEIATGQYWIHPALPEVIENALLGLEV